MTDQTKPAVPLPTEHVIINGLWEEQQGPYSAEQMLAYGDAREAAATAEVERLRAEIDNVDAERVVAKSMQRLHAAEVERLSGELAALEDDVKAEREEAGFWCNQCSIRAAELAAIKAADKAMPRYSYGYKTSDSGDRDLSSYQDDNGKFVLHSDALAAVAAAQAREVPAGAYLSWNGFNLRGDVASIEEARRLVEFESARRLPASPSQPAAAQADPPARIYERAYTEGLNDCLRNGLEWARSQFVPTQAAAPRAAREGA